jgi:hypothetical protein
MMTAVAATKLADPRTPISRLASSTFAKGEI